MLVRTVSGDCAPTCQAPSDQMLAFGSPCCQGGVRRALCRAVHCQAIHPRRQVRRQSTAARVARGPPDDLLLILQLAANKALVLLIDCPVELARWRGRHIPLRRPQRRLYPVHLRRLAAAKTPSHCSHHECVATCAPIRCQQTPSRAHAECQESTPRKASVRTHCHTSRFVCMIHLRRAMMSACVSPNFRVFFSATSTAFESSSTCST